MVGRDVVQVLDEIRRGNGLSYAELAQRTGQPTSAVAAFFEGEGAREEALGMALAGALGLRTERCVTCAGAVVDYYKSGIYFSSDEMEMLRLYRGMDLPVREKLVGLLAAVYNADRKNGR